MTAYLARVANLRLALIAFTISTMRNGIASILALTRLCYVLCYVVEDLDRVMAKYKATYQTGTKSTTSQARKRKDQRKKKGERGTS